MNPYINLWTNNSLWVEIWFSYAHNNYIQRQAKFSSSIAPPKSHRSKCCVFGHCNTHSVNILVVQRPVTVVNWLQLHAANQHAGSNMWFWLLKTFVPLAKIVGLQIARHFWVYISKDCKLCNFTAHSTNWFSCQLQNLLKMVIFQTSLLIYLHIHTCIQKSNVCLGIITCRIRETSLTSLIKLTGMSNMYWASEHGTQTAFAFSLFASSVVHNCRHMAVNAIATEHSTPRKCL